MKINIRLTKSQARVLAFHTQVQYVVAQTREQKVAFSLMREVSIFTERFFMNYTSEKKLKKLHLKIYHADILERFLNDRILQISDEYAKSTFIYIIGQINQQLV